MNFGLFTITKLENGSGWIEYAVAIITATKHLPAVITAAAYSTQLPLFSFVVVIGQFHRLKMKLSNVKLQKN
jgi:hypothetical protein